MKRYSFLILILLEAVKALARGVVTFPCGNDVCIANERYCNKHDSDDYKKWTCTSCDEEKSGCPTLNVHPHCYGYCQNLSAQIIQHGLQVQIDTLKRRLEIAEQKNNQSLVSVILQWKAANDTYDEIVINVKEHSDHQRMIINGLSVSTALLFVLLICWIMYNCCHKPNSKGSLSNLSTANSTDSADQNDLKEVLVKRQENEEPEGHVCEGTRRAREIMTNQRPADNDGPSKLAAH